MRIPFRGIYLLDAIPHLEHWPEVLASDLEDGFVNVDLLVHQPRKEGKGKVKK